MPRSLESALRYRVVVPVHRIPHLARANTPITGKGVPQDSSYSDQNSDQSIEAETRNILGLVGATLLVLASATTWARIVPANLTSRHGTRLPDPLCTTRYSILQANHVSC